MTFALPNRKPNAFVNSVDDVSIKISVCIYILFPGEETVMFEHWTFQQMHLFYSLRGFDFTHSFVVELRSC